MIDFIKKYSDKNLLIVFILSITLYLVAPLFIYENNPMDQPTSATFIMILFGIIPWIVTFIIGLNIRNNIRKNEKFSVGEYFVVILVGGIVIGITLIPVIIPLMLYMNHLGFPTKENLADYNFKVNLIAFIPYFPVTIYVIGATSSILNRMKPTFTLKEAFMVFKNPYLIILLKWSLLFYFIPTIINIASFKFKFPYWLSFISYYIKMISALLYVIIPIYLLTIKDSINSKEV